MLRSSQQPGLELVRDLDEKQHMQIEDAGHPSYSGTVVELNRDSIRRPISCRSVGAYTAPTTGWSPIEHQGLPAQHLTGKYASTSFDHSITLLDQNLSCQRPPSPSERMASAGLCNQPQFTAQVAEKGYPKSIGKRVCFMPVSRFCLVLVLVLFGIAAIIGASVGGAAAMDRAQHPQTEAPATETLTVTASPLAATITNSMSTQTISSTLISTPTSATRTTAAIISVPTTGILPLDCTSASNVNNTTTSISLGTQSWNFGITCGQDFQAPLAKDMIDIAGFISYSLTDCAQACASYNRNYEQDVCIAVVWNSDLTTSVATSFANCFLKNSTTNTLSSEDTKYVGMRLLNSTRS